MNNFHYNQSDLYKTTKALLTTLREDVDSVKKKVASVKVGDNTTFGVVVSISNDSITFKAKDLPKTTIKFNQRRIGSSDYVLDSLKVLSEETVDESTEDDDSSVLSEMNFKAMKDNELIIWLGNNWTNSSLGKLHKVQLDTATQEAKRRKLYIRGITDLDESVSTSPESIADIVAKINVGDNTNFGIVMSKSADSITFKAKDLPKTTIKYNQRRIGSSDYTLAKLTKMSMQEGKYGPDSEEFPRKPSNEKEYASGKFATAYLKRYVSASLATTGDKLDRKERAGVLAKAGFNSNIINDVVDSLKESSTLEESYSKNSRVNKIITMINDFDAEETGVFFTDLAKYYEGEAENDKDFRPIASSVDSCRLTWKRLFESKGDSHSTVLEESFASPKDKTRLEKDGYEFRNTGVMTSDDEDTEDIKVDIYIKGKQECLVNSDYDIEVYYPPLKGSAPGSKVTKISDKKYEVY